MSFISSRVNSLSMSATMAMSQKSAELKANGVDIINLGVGEPDFNTPDYIKEAAIRAIHENFTRYTPVGGYLSLRQAIVENLKATNGVEYSTDQIVASNGAKQALCNAILSTVNPGDEVIIPTPAWVSYMEMVKLAEGVCVTVPASIDRNFKITPDQLRGAITPRTKMIIFCNPSNPTGSVYSPEELQGLVDVIHNCNNILVLADEVYQQINFTDNFRSLGSFPEIADRTIVVNGVSKAYAMTGWRIGFVAAPLPIANACAKLQSQTTSNPSSVAQKAAEAAYRGPQNAVAEMRESFRRRRDLTVELASQIPGLKTCFPQGAFYLFPDVSAFLGKSYDGKVIKDSGELCLYLLDHAHVATVDGAAFAMPGFIRISYATSEENIREAMGRIARALALLS